MLWLPNASQQVWRDDKGNIINGGTFTDAGEPKGVLHTTETGSWPGYGGGQSAPHATIRPLPTVGVEVRQHVPFDLAARALRNPAGGVQTNRDRAFQFELIGTCDPSYARKYGYYFWPEADDAVLLDLYRKVIKPVSDAHGVPVTAPEFLAYPASYGNSRVRMSGARFDAYSGWLGHEHVAENTHGDPGAFPWARLMGLIGGAIPITPAVPTAPPVPSDLLRRGDQGPAVVSLQARLRDLGYNIGAAGADGIFGGDTEDAVKALQKNAGIGQDGVVGPNTRSALDHGVRAVAVVSVPPCPGVTRQGMRNSAVTRAFQTVLWRRGWDIAIDGNHGPATTGILRAFQAEKGLIPDGVGGEHTWRALHTAGGAVWR